MKMEPFELIQLVDPSTPAGAKVKRKPTNDWRRWPRAYRLLAEKAVREKLAALPKGSKIVKRRSRCDVRADLTGIPWQLYLGVEVKIA